MKDEAPALRGFQRGSEAATLAPESTAMPTGIFRRGAFHVDALHPHRIHRERVHCPGRVHRRDVHNCQIVAVFVASDDAFIVVDEVTGAAEDRCPGRSGASGPTAGSTAQFSSRRISTSPCKRISRDDDPT